MDSKDVIGKMDAQIERAFVAARDWGTKGNALVHTKPYVAVGLGVGAGIATGVLLGTRVARFALLMAAGYGMHSLSGQGKPLMEAGLHRLERALAV